jgi:hypothetical protein
MTQPEAAQQRVERAIAEGQGLNLRLLEGDPGPQATSSTRLPAPTSAASSRAAVASAVTGEKKAS